MQANEGEGSLPWDRFSHVFDLVQNGNKAFRENRFEEVIFFPLTVCACSPLPLYLLKFLGGVLCSNASNAMEKLSKVFFK